MPTFRIDGHPPAEVYKLLVSAVVPRPIAWVSTLSEEGIANLAPYSFFNVASIDPPVLMFAPQMAPTSTQGQPDGGARTKDQDTQHMSWTLGDAYTACTDAAAFDVVSDVACDLCGFANRADAAKAARTRNWLCHLVRFATFLVYVALVAGSTPYAAVAVANVIVAFLRTHVVVESTGLSRGDRPRQVVDGVR
ncbi:MAG: hypothetical protein AAFX41_04825, partial [Bacteroidota bacterium]